MDNNYYIENDERTVWINGRYSILGRFCPISQEIFNPKVSPLNPGNIYLYYKLHKNSKPKIDDWDGFCYLMKQKLDIDIPQRYKPKYISS